MKKKVNETKGRENVYEKPVMEEIKFETKRVPEMVASSGCSCSSCTGCSACSSCGACGCGGSCGCS